MQNSSSTATDTAPTRRIPEHEWDLPGRIPAKPPAWDYGYVLKGEAIGSTREHLSEILLARGVTEIKFVWTPETPDPVFPEKVPLLVDAFKKIALKEARHGILWGAAFLALGIVLTVGLEQWDLMYRNIFSVFGALALVEGVWQYARSRHYTQQDAARDASGARFASWIKEKPLSGFTVTLGASIVTVGTVQLFAGESIRKGRLSKTGGVGGPNLAAVHCIIDARKLHPLLAELSRAAAAFEGNRTNNSACLGAIGFSSDRNFGLPLQRLAISSHNIGGCLWRANGPAGLHHHSGALR